MRRWNGWGDSLVDAQLHNDSQAFLEQRLGPGRAASDADLSVVCGQLDASRLPEHSLIKRDAETRVRHARGQSLPDWIALRSGQIGPVPDAVAFPESSQQVAELLQWADQQQALVIAWGGGTSVAGHVSTPESPQPVLVISLARMNRLLDLDSKSQLARFGAGVNGPQLEAQLAPHGYTLGHFPQSFELSTLGGWVAARSSGQQSLRYGRIEQLFAGGRVETWAGRLDLPPLPASAAGPDLREWILGSEGRFGLITEIDVRVSRLPQREVFEAAFLPDFEHGCQALRELSQQRVALSMLRLSNAEETITQLALAGKPGLVSWLRRWLRLRGIGEDGCLLMLGASGTARQVKAARRQAAAILRQNGGCRIGTALGKQWAKRRFHLPYLRNTLWDAGYAIDTLETAVRWDRLDDMMAAVEDALRQAFAAGQVPAHVFSHLSHVYSSGASLYTTYVFPLGETPEQTLGLWQDAKSAASDAIVANAGTISHQHGVGRDHAPWLAAEKGQLGIEALRAACQHFDPQGQLNPGCLVADDRQDHD